ncbi:MAG TPA: hypothetical protein VMA75_03245 [Candidatus Paceibacterota bacterium]|nr:hypothetical protein [Candidatus Paceibacterota bacterium]
MKIAKKRNGMRYPSSIREKARELRSGGSTHREIARELNVSVSTVNIWVQGIVLSLQQHIEIQKRRHQHEWTDEEKERARRKLKEFWSPIRYTRQDLLEKIKEFHRKNGRIPLKREFNSFKVFKREFGGWNQAIIAAGFDANPVQFARKFIADDGHPCDSFTEKVIDDWLLKKHIMHERHWRYGDTKMTADFFIQPNIVVEFFGLAGVQNKYDGRLEKKRRFCAERNLRLIEIYPKDIYPTSTLDRKNFR